jgi:hypothetical protein
VHRSGIAAIAGSSQRNAVVGERCCTRKTLAITADSPHFNLGDRHDVGGAPFVKRCFERVGEANFKKNGRSMGA